MVLAHLAAEIVGRWSGPAGESSSWNQVVLFRAVFSFWVAVILLTPALAFYILLRPNGPVTYWRAFWTVSLLAYLTYLAWVSVVWSAANIGAIYFIFAIWWALDVALAWMSPAPTLVIHIQRGLLHLIAFAIFFAATLLAGITTPVDRLLGAVMTITVLFVLVLRIITREAAPNSFFHVLFLQSFTLLNRFVVWHKLPTWLAVINLGVLRDVLRAKNLHNTSDIPVTESGGLRPEPSFHPDFLADREKDGFYNDLEKPAMGCASLNPNDPLNSSDFTQSHPSARFGRNIPLSEVDPTRDGALMDPSPRQISEELLARKAVTPDGDFRRATTLNLLAAAWIQFQTHDWFNHGNPIEENPYEVPLEKEKWHESPMKVRRTRPDPTRKPNDGKGPTTYANAESHWWDASQIYGSSTQAADKLRSKQGGKITVGNDGLLPLDHEGIETTGLTSNWWLGLSLLHNLFVQEHNAICDHLARFYPDWSDDELYRTARMVNSAVLAKIHTVDWTPAILGHPALQIAMNANWWGVFGEHLKKMVGRISEAEAFSGIPGSSTNHHSGDYCLTEEFVSVYRMHPLMPDDIPIYSLENDSRLRLLKLGAEADNDPDEATGPDARANALRGGGQMSNLFYSFGVQSPGALTLHNFPNWMRRVRRRHGKEVQEFIDLATIDVLRDRERGVPRYNRFRELFHLPRVRKFDELTPNKEWAQELDKVYKSVDKVDLMVGLFAEEPPEGFGFSDTAFRVFILMASRRLKSDRFFTRDWTPDVYSPEGMAWVNDNNMTTVLQRHYPELVPVMQGVANPFAPWNRVKTLPAGPAK
jgi:hypothetical protein